MSSPGQQKTDDKYDNDDGRDCVCLLNWPPHTVGSDEMVLRALKFWTGSRQMVSFTLRQICRPLGRRLGGLQLIKISGGKKSYFCRESNPRRQSHRRQV
jgi:hypothetical protein